MSARWVALSLGLVVGLALVAVLLFGEPPLRVGSKKFTESVVLGEVLNLLVASEGETCEHMDEMGGTRIVFDALVGGDIDAYVEYTGTLQRDILASERPRDVEEVRASLEAKGVRLGPALGFNNSYDLGMRKIRAEELGIRTISDLRSHPGLAVGLTHEFLQRADGWPGLKRRYGLPQKTVNGIDHNLAYDAIASGSIDLMDVYTTDAKNKLHDLLVLDDDLDYFPAYEAVVLYRIDLEETHPEIVEAFRSLAGRIDAETMTGMNASVVVDKKYAPQVAGMFLEETFQIYVTPPEETWQARLWKRTKEQFALVGASLAAALILGIGLGILAAKTGAFGEVIVAVVGAAQTFPGIALLALFIPVMGIGWKPAVVALIVYSLLPIVRNTHAGLVGIPRSLRESAEVLELGATRRLMAVELPLALPSMLAGIKTAAVWNVGLATLGGLIAAGGYGESIFQGLRRSDTSLILEGAIPSILMALVLQYLFEALEKRAVR